MKLSKELKVGLLGIASLSVLFCGGMFMKGNDIFSLHNHYYYAYVDNAEGLLAGTSVVINGAKIGMIKKLKLLPKENFRTRVTISVDKAVQLYQNSTLAITSNLLGKRSMKLEINEGELLPKRGEIKIKRSTDIFSDVKDKTSPLIDNVQELIKTINIFATNLNTNDKNIKNTISNLEQTTDALTKMIIKLSPQILSLTNNLNSILQEMNDKDHGVKNILVKVNSFANEVQNMKLLEITNGIKDCIEKVKTDPILDNSNVTILKLQKAIQDLDTLLIDIRLNPHNYVNFSLWGNKKSNSIKE